eukprot:3741847-Prymnesium_polylepis.2
MGHGGVQAQPREPLPCWGHQGLRRGAITTVRFTVLELHGGDRGNLEPFALFAGRAAALRFDPGRPFFEHSPSRALKQRLHVRHHVLLADRVDPVAVHRRVGLLLQPEAERLVQLDGAPGPLPPDILSGIFRRPVHFHDELDMRHTVRLHSSSQLAKRRRPEPSVPLALFRLEHLRDEPSDLLLRRAWHFQVAHDGKDEPTKVPVHARLADEIPVHLGRAPGVATAALAALAALAIAALAIAALAAALTRVHRLVAALTAALIRAHRL